MFVRVKLGTKILDIPFSDKHIANCFTRGFNEQYRAHIQEKEYPFANDYERRGASFCAKCLRYCAANGISLKSTQLEVSDVQENTQSLFDGW